MNKSCGYLQSLYDEIRTISLFFSSPSVYLNKLQAVVNCDCVSLCLHLIFILRHVMNPERFLKRNPSPPSALIRSPPKKSTLRDTSCFTLTVAELTTIITVHSISDFRYLVNEHLKKGKREPGQTCT